MVWLFFLAGDSRIHLACSWLVDEWILWKWARNLLFLACLFFFPHSVLHKTKANGHLDGVFVNATLIEMDWVTLGVSHLRRQVDGWVVQDTSFPKRTTENERGRSTVLAL